MAHRTGGPPPPRSQSQGRGWRGWLRPGIAAAVLVGLVAALLVPGGILDHVGNGGRPNPTPTPTASAPQGKQPWNQIKTVTLKDLPRVGVATGGVLAYMDAPSLHATVNSMAKHHVRLVRWDADWSEIQPSGPSPGGNAASDWSATDRLANQFSAKHIWSQVILAYAPPWAAGSQSCGDGHCLARGKYVYQYIQTFVRAAVHRYHGAVRVWEIGNEVNLAANNAPTFRADPYQYAHDLIVAAETIKSIDPGALVLPAGLAPANTENGDMDPRQFFADMMNAGGVRLQHLIGGANVHPYGFPDMFPVSHSQYNTWWRTVQPDHGSILSTATRWGLPGVELSEYGAPTAGDNHVSVEVQFKMNQEAILEVLSHPRLGPIFLFNWKDDQDGAFGLLDSHGHAKSQAQMKFYEQAFAGKLSTKR